MWERSEEESKGHCKKTEKIEKKFSHSVTWDLRKGPLEYVAKGDFEFSVLRIFEQLFRECSAWPPNLILEQKQFSSHTHVPELNNKNRKFSFFFSFRKTNRKIPLTPISREKQGRKTARKLSPRLPPHAPLEK